MSENTVDPRTTRIEENGVTFPLLMLDDHEAVEAECLKKIMDVAGAMATACGMKSGNDRFGSISTIVPLQVDLQHIYTFAFSPHGMRFILSKSLTRQGVAKDEQGAIIGKYAGFDGFNLAMAVMGHQKRFTIEQIDAELMRRAVAASIGEEKKPTKKPEGSNSPPDSGEPE